MFVKRELRWSVCVGGRSGREGEGAWSGGGVGGDSSVSYASTGRSSSVSGEVEWLVPANHAAAAVGTGGRQEKERRREKIRQVEKGRKKEREK